MVKRQKFRVKIKEAEPEGKPEVEVIEEEVKETPEEEEKPREPPKSPSEIYLDLGRRLTEINKQIKELSVEKGRILAKMASIEVDLEMEGKEKIEGESYLRTEET